MSDFGENGAMSFARNDLGAFCTGEELRATRFKPDDPFRPSSIAMPANDFYRKGFASEIG